MSKNRDRSYTDGNKRCYVCKSCQPRETQDMTSWNAQIGKGTYRLQFETTDPEKYKAVEKLVQDMVDMPEMYEHISCDHLNENLLWVSKEVYDRIRNSRGGVIMDTPGENPILVSWYSPSPSSAIKQRRKTK